MKEVTILSEPDLTRIRDAARLIEKDLKYHYRIEELAATFMINSNKLKQGFKKEYGVGPYTFLMQKRMEKAKAMLMENKSIISVALAVGFSGTYAETNFIKYFKKVAGLPPAEWRKQQELKRDNKLSA